MMVRFEDGKVGDQMVVRLRGLVRRKITSSL